MIDPMQILLQFVAKNSRFPANSRYQGIDTGVLVDAQGKPIAYLRRRFVPGPGQFVAMQEHTVTAGDRLDTIAAHYLGDPELFWRVADANAAMRPEDLTAPSEIGRRLRITLPEGMPGPSNA